MKGSFLAARPWLVLFATLTVGVALLATLGPGKQGARATLTKDTSPARDSESPTSDQILMTAAERMLTQRIRKAIHRDKDLSRDGRNINIFTHNGKVILRGPVRSEAEKSSLAVKASVAAGELNVSNQLVVVQSGKVN